MKRTNDKFRRSPRARLGIKIPVGLDSRVRAKAFKRGVPLDYAVTEALARWVGLDPATFGIEAQPSNSPQ